MSVWGVRLFWLLFTWEEWWLNFRGSISMQQTDFKKIIISQSHHDSSVSGRRRQLILCKMFGAPNFFFFFQL